MGKRRRKDQQQESRDKTTTEPPPSRVNPFLAQAAAAPSDRASDGDHRADDVLRWMLAFVDHAKPSTDKELLLFREAVNGLVKTLKALDRGADQHADDADDDDDISLDNDDDFMEEDGNNDHNSSQEEANLFEDDVVLGGMNKRSKRPREQQQATKDCGEGGCTAGGYALEIARLLLPWTIQQINKLLDHHHHSNSSIAETALPLAVPEHYCWQALRFSLSHILTKQCGGGGRGSSGNDATSTAPFLTQSILFKLVPRLAQLAVTTTSDKSRASRIKHSPKVEAAKVYRVLLVHRLYTPTLDVAVETVFLPLVETMKLHETYTWRRILPTLSGATTTSTGTTAGAMSVQRAHASLQTTLQWIHKLMTRQGHPKTNFGVLARRPVLLALARVHFLWQALPDGRLLSEVDYGEDDVDEAAGASATTGGDGGKANSFSRQVLHKMLYNGLFAPKHHMDGFKSLSVSSNFTCYQNDLLQTISTILRDGTALNDVRDLAWFLPVLLRNCLDASRAWYQDQPVKQKKRSPPLSALQFAMFQRMAEPLLETLQEQVNDSSVTTVGLRALREMHDLLEEYQAYVPAYDDPKDQPHFGFLQNVATFVLEQPVDPQCFSGLEQFSDKILLVTRLMHLNHLLWQPKFGQQHEQQQQYWPKVLSLSLQSSDARLRGSVCAQWCGATEIFTQLRQVDDWVRILVAVAHSLDFVEHSDVLADVLTESSVEQALALHVQSCPVKQIPEVFLVIQRALTCPKENNLSMVIHPLATIVLRSFKVDPTTVDIVSDSLHDLVTGTMNALVESDVSIVRKVCTEVFGWCIDLSMRCAFWLGPSALLPIPDSVQAAISRSTETDGLLLVTAHRLRQLSSLLHEKRLAQVRQETTSLGDELDALEKEAARLASHLYARARASSSGSGWILISQFLQFWIPFVSQDQVDGFLGWLLAVLSLDTSIEENVPSCFLVPGTNDLAKQKEVAQTLLHDEAFHETSMVAERLPVAAVRNAALWIIFAIAGSPKPGEDSNTEGFISDVDEIMDLDESDFLEEWGSVYFGDGLSNADRDATERRLCCALESIRILNGIPIDSSAPALSLLYLDRLVCDAYLKSLDVRFYVTAISLSSCIRRALPMVLRAKDAKTTRAILNYLRDTTTKCLLSDNTVGSNDEDEAFFHLSGNIVECLVKELLVMNHGESVLREWFEKLLPVEEDSSRSLRGDDGVLIICTFRALAESTLSAANEFAGRVIERYFKSFQSTSSATWGNVMTCKVIAEALLHRSDPVEGFGHASIREILITLCLNWMDAEAKPEMFLPIFLSLLSTQDTLKEILLNQVLSNVAVMERGGSNVPPIVSACVKRLSDDSFVDFVDVLVGPEQEGQYTRLNLVRLLFSEAFVPDALADAFNESKDKLLDFALYAMFQGTGPDENVAPMATDVWFQAVQSGHSIKKEKLPVVVGRIAQVLGPGDRSTSLYTACARLLALLLQRYSKHLSVCAPIVVVALQSLLRQLTDADLSIEDLSLRARYWTRLCELLVHQKEVYKKHAVHLVLESLRAADDANLRRALMPGWMHLLDAFSPAYELKQLNALMVDQSTKMKFRPIYEQYRSHHAYQGH